MKRQAAFATSDIAPDWVLAGPDFALAWVEDQSRIIAETSTRRRRRLSDQLVMISADDSLRVAVLVADNGNTMGGRIGATSAVMRAKMEEVDRAIRAVAAPTRPSTAGRAMTTPTTKVPSAREAMCTRLSPGTSCSCFRF